MEDGETNEGDKGGEKPNNDSTENKDDSTPAEKVRKDTEELKAENDAYDKQKLRAEIIRAERQRGGQSNAGQQEEKKEETPKEYADKVMKGEIKNGKN